MKTKEAEIIRLEGALQRGKRLIEEKHYYKVSKIYKTNAHIRAKIRRLIKGEKE